MTPHEANVRLLEEASPDELKQYLCQFAYESVWAPLAVLGKWQDAVRAYSRAYADLSEAAKIRFESALRDSMGRSIHRVEQRLEGTARLGRIAAAIDSRGAIRPLIVSLAYACGTGYDPMEEVGSISGRGPAHSILSALDVLSRTHTDPEVATELHLLPQLFEAYPYLTTQVLCRSMPDSWVTWTRKLFERIGRGEIARDPMYLRYLTIHVIKPLRLVRDLPKTLANQWDLYSQILFDPSDQVLRVQMSPDEFPELSWAGGDHPLPIELRDGQFSSINQPGFEQDLATIHHDLMLEEEGA